MAAVVEMMRVEAETGVEETEVEGGNPLEKEEAQLQWLQPVSPPLLQSHRHTKVLQLSADKTQLPFQAHH